MASGFVKQHMTFHAVAAAAGCLLGAVLLLGCTTPPDSAVVTTGTLIRGVNVVDTRDGSLAPHMAVAIANGRIQRIVPDAQVRAAAAVHIVDARGRYLVPGYLDMHTHALPAAPWPVLVGHGITGIREMSGSAALIQRAGQLNADSAAGRIDAPEILQVPSDIVAAVPSAAAAAGIVARQKADGASFIKVVNGSHDGMLALLAESQRQGLAVAGHLPLALPSQAAAANGWQAVEHLGSGLGSLLDCAVEGESIRQALLRGEGAKPAPPGPASIMSPMSSRALDAPFYQRAMASHDEGRCRQVASAFAQHKTWQVPTLIRLRTMMQADAGTYRNDPNLRHVDKALVALWQQFGDAFSTAVPAPAAQVFRQYYEAQKRFTKLLADSGVPLLAGSDLGGIWVIPGIGLHQEFRELAAAGLSSLQVLQMTTLNGARFLGREATMGTVEAGKNADLVLLEANPLERVENLSRIAGVFLKGRYLPREVLQQRMDERARRLASQPPQDARAMADLNHVH